MNAKAPKPQAKTIDAPRRTRTATKVKAAFGFVFLRELRRTFSLPCFCPTLACWRLGIHLLCLLLLVGCRSYEARTYDVTVANVSSGPITIWLTKNGPPFEASWLSPEDMAVESPRGPQGAIGGVVVPEGKTARTGPRKGQFDSGTRAILRVYSGALTFDQMLASSSESRSRVDVRLPPGQSAYVVTGAPGAIEVKERTQAP
jgi:hypothetical protein